MKDWTLLAACGLLVALGLPTQAEARPAVDAVRDGMGKERKVFRQGDVVRLDGRGFHTCPAPPDGASQPAPCAHDGLTVTVAGLTALVTESAADHVTFIVPQQARPRKAARVVVRLRGSGEATATITVVEYRQGPPNAPDGGSLDESTVFLQRVGFTRFEHVREGHKDRFIVEGFAKGFPDKLTVQLELSFAGERLPRGLDLVAIRGERFRHTFGPYERKVVPGRYQLDLLFELGKQSKKKVRRWLPTLSDAAREVYEGLRRRQFAVAGTPADGARVADEVRARSLALIQGLDELRADMHTTVADAGRAFCRKGRAVDEAEYRRWLQRAQFAATPEDAKALASNQRRFSKPSGQFDAKAYRAWLTSTVQALEELVVTYRRWEDRYLSKPNPKATELGEWLVAIVETRLAYWTDQLYGHSELERPRVALSVEVARPEEISARFFDAKRRELLHRIGGE